MCNYFVERLHQIRKKILRIIFRDKSIFFANVKGKYNLKSCAAYTQVSEMPLIKALREVALSKRKVNKENMIIFLQPCISAETAPNNSPLSMKT